MRRFAWSFLLIAFASQGQPSDGVFPELYGRTAQAPPEILAQREWTLADEQPKDARNVISNERVQNPLNLPLGPNSRVLATFTPQPDKGPVRLVLDWAGSELAKADPNSRDAIVVVNAFFACEGTRDSCLEGPPHAREIQKLFFVPPMLSEGTVLRDVVVDGKARTMYVSHGVLTNTFSAGKPVTVHLSFGSPPHFETYRLRTTLLYGDYTTQRPVEHAPPQQWWRIATIAALLVLAASWWRRGRSDEAFESDDPPKVLGSLLRVLGLLWSIIGLVSFDTYSMALGVLLAFAGGLLYYGRSLAVPAMWLLVAVAWTWSIREVGADMKLLFPRVGLITILWLWVVFGGTASRLGTRGV